MKKLAAFFIILISLTVLIGCSGSKKTITTSSNNGTKTTVTKLEQGKTTTKTPPKATTDSSKSTTKATKTATDTTPVKKDISVKFAIISLINNKLDTSKSYNVISGLTPKNTSKVIVNNYILNKYKAGDTKWSYIAATSLGTLKKGKNNYTVSAFDSKGNILGTQDFTINYKGANNGSLASTGSPSLFILLLSLIPGLVIGSLYIKCRMA